MNWILKNYYTLTDSQLKIELARTPSYHLTIKDQWTPMDREKAIGALHRFDIQERLFKDEWKKDIKF